MQYKGSIHLHTTKSDGELSPEKTCESYSEKGYDFIAFTDHNVFTKVDTKSIKDFLVIENSIEFNLPGSYTHILGIGMGTTEIKEMSSNQEIIDNIIDCKGVAIVAHPNWRWGPGFSELLRLKNYHGIEIYNSGVKEPPISEYAGSPFSTDKWDYTCEICSMKD